MPRPVCVACKREMAMVRPVAVQFNSHVVGPYERWMGDLARCEGCGTEVVTAWAFQPYWRHTMTVHGEQPELVVEERAPHAS